MNMSTKNILHSPVSKMFKDKMSYPLTTSESIHLENELIDGTLDLLHF